MSLWSPRPVAITVFIWKIVFFSEILNGRHVWNSYYHYRPCGSKTHFLSIDCPLPSGTTSGLVLLLLPVVALFLTKLSLSQLLTKLSLEQLSSASSMLFQSQFFEAAVFSKFAEHSWGFPFPVFFFLIFRFRVLPPENDGFTTEFKSPWLFGFRTLE